jgi:hypothetical protein
MLDLEGNVIDTTCNCDAEWDGFDHHFYPCNYPPCVMARDLEMRYWTRR